LQGEAFGDRRWRSRDVRIRIKCDDDMIGHWQFQTGFKLGTGGGGGRRLPPYLAAADMKAAEAECAGGRAMAEAAKGEKRLRSTRLAGLKLRATTPAHVIVSIM
jgi:hypothetical protein